MKFIILLFQFCITLALCAQVPYNEAAPNGYTKKASVSEEVGLTLITIDYHRPLVNGREGRIWGGVVHKGFMDLGFGKRKPAPWRAGANENTTFETDHDIKVQGQLLRKGKYGMFIAYDSLESLVIFSARTDAWGSFFYDQAEDVLRVKAIPKKLEKSVESLKYEFTNQSPGSAEIVLSWEELSIPLKVEVDYLKQQFEAFVAESQNPGGFTSEGLNIAAGWCLQNNYELERALEWSTLATAPGFPGNPSSFAALITKSAILEKLGRNAESESVLASALPYGSLLQLHQLGNQLLSAQEIKKAFQVFEFNYRKHPQEFFALTGMAKCLSAMGEKSKAVIYAKQALPLAPNDLSRRAVDDLIRKLQN